ncbi:A disintegrin and metalloproteinase with thrombospondin motifs 9-like [Chelonus insularis]|uniref:A disintegrin and metalloproteinase with thrombospondin motifs 9-like n=1 Tax=Chelonus insularis TaxID=460826 RepID=UPI001588D33B|nr:A disintegrin and metalloproteinase with thrombospondin motifs 9-like [Chelonus insularis]
MWNLSKIFVVFGFISLYSRHVIVGSPVMSVNQVSTRPYRNNTQNTPRIRSNSFQMLRDPWFHPKDGILATANTKVFAILKDNNTNLECHEINNAVHDIVARSSHLFFAQTTSEVFSNRQRRNRYSRERRLRTRKMTPKYTKVVYPELAIAVSYEYFKKFKFDYWTIIPYLLSFWNAVDMRYRGLENPKYRFHISQFIFEAEPGNFKFLKENGSPDYLTYDCVYNARNFWYEQKELIPLDSYDMIIIMTSSIICMKYDKVTNKCLPQIFGQAWPSGACSVHHNIKQIDKLAIIHDNGAYEGVTTAAHEIGHLLGALDDGVSVYNSTTEEWGPPQCDLWDGYIMSGNKQASQNAFEWSECSVKKFEKFIYSESASCLYNKPKSVGRPIPRYLPGKLMNADEQCKQAGAIESCEDKVSNCIMLQCRFEDEGCINTTAPAVEGTNCGLNTVGHICIHGECVPEINFI